MVKIKKAYDLWKMRNPILKSQINESEFRSKLNDSLTILSDDEKKSIYTKKVKDEYIEVYKCSCISRIKHKNIVRIKDMHNIWKSRNSMLKHMLNENELNRIYKKSMRILSTIERKELLDVIKLEFQERKELLDVIKLEFQDKNNEGMIKKNVRLGKK